MHYVSVCRIGSSALRNPLDLPLHSHSRTCFSSNSITSSSVASASSYPLSPGLVNHDHRNQSMRYDNTWAARHRTSSSLNPHDKATKGGAATASGDSGSDPQLTKIMRAGRAYRCRLCDQVRKLISKDLAFCCPPNWRHT